ncbi:unnamed protein product [Paramecium sonneborni]|uniref:non-specific serine/threonine protein kinase n=1 Tax=Paramecium sonneborni TaxID=65129 RepID=A0A8S1LI66_9CILI|nr:unnamed protein product [Paramecium sonneborni]
MLLELRRVSKTILIQFLFNNMGLCISTKEGEQQMNEELMKAPIATYEQIEENGEQLFVDDNQDAILKLSDFQFEKVLGRGSFGKVMLVTHKSTNKLYAMKILRKEMIEKRNQRLHMQNERTILENVKNPFIVQLHYAFQTKTKLYLIMDFLIGGELFFHLRRAFRFQEERAKFYTAELVLALEYLHKSDIIYRDLKPENILLDIEGHLKITDFGLSKINVKGDEKTNTFCGTPEYLAPEILLGGGHNKSVDWWSLGALLYEMLAGAPPFYSKDKTQMFKNRLEKPIEMKEWFSNAARSVLNGLLQNDPTKRLGANGSQEIKDHEFFREIDWDKLYNKQIQPPFKPKVFGHKDLRHFDDMFTQEPPQDTPINKMQKYETYERFTFVKTNEINDLNKDEEKFIEVNENFKLQKI